MQLIAYGSRRWPTIQEALSVLAGVRRIGGGWSALCPAHADRTPSLTLAEGGRSKLLLHCHAGCSFEQVIGAIRGRLQSRPRAHPMAGAMAPSLSSLGFAKRSLLSPSSQHGSADPVIWWATKTGIPWSWWAEHGAVVRSGRVALAFGNGVYKIRTDGPAVGETGITSGKYAWLKPVAMSAPSVLWPVPTIGGAGDTLILTEGETDAATLLYNGYPAVALTKGAAGTDLSRYYAMWRRAGVRTLLVSFDADDAGRHGACRLLPLLRGAGFLACAAPPPISESLAVQGGKDWNDLWGYCDCDGAVFDTLAGLARHEGCVWLRAHSRSAYWRPFPCAVRVAPLVEILAP